MKIVILAYIASLFKIQLPAPEETVRTILDEENHNSIRDNWQLLSVSLTTANYFLVHVMTVCLRFSVLILLLGSLIFGHTDTEFTIIPQFFSSLSFFDFYDGFTLHSEILIPLLLHLSFLIRPAQNTNDNI